MAESFSNYQIDGRETRFHQAAAVVGPREEGARRMPSGVTLYRVRGGPVDDGRFIPLGKIQPGHR